MCFNHLEFEFFTLFMVKFIYSEKATKFCEISTLHLSYVVPVKNKVEIPQNFVAISEYMNFIQQPFHKFEIHFETLILFGMIYLKNV